MMTRSLLAVVISTCFKPITSAVAMVVLLSLSFFPAHFAHAASVRLKDIARVKDVRDNQVIGYGLVVGLNKTGDRSRSTQAAQMNLITNMGGRLSSINDIRGTNSASVIVTATIPPFAKPGDRLDVVVSSLADAGSLEGGVLVSTQLQAPNGEIVAVAQGPVSTGGTSVSANGSEKRTAITTTGRVPNGAIIEREIMTDLGDAVGMDLVLDRTDFTLANRVAEAVNKISPATALDGSTIRVQLAGNWSNNRVGFISKMENLMVETTQEVAKVVVNERTGTVVIGQYVRLLPAAVAHGGITVTISTDNSVSQPNAFAPDNAQTVGVSNSQISIDEAKASLVQLKANATLRDLVSALNALEITPSDLIAVLQALKAAGSLEADLEII
ncbi:MAG: flagellar basal body P-ring protein FlgI [Vampirovibrionales bacterium]|nr:flagellar basal body P-ring protein FlgI [Vampirovibrionales bacterium]